MAASFARVKAEWMQWVQEEEFSSRWVQPVPHAAPKRQKFWSHNREALYAERHLPRGSFSLIPNVGKFEDRLLIVPVEQMAEKVYEDWNVWGKLLHDKEIFFSRFSKKYEGTRIKDTAWLLKRLIDVAYPLAQPVGRNQTTSDDTPAPTVGSLGSSSISESSSEIDPATESSHHQHRDTFHNDTQSGGWQHQSQNALHDTPRSEAKEAKLPVTSKLSDKSGFTKAREEHPTLENSARRIDIVSSSPTKIPGKPDSSMRQQPHTPVTNRRLSSKRPHTPGSGKPVTPSLPSTPTQQSISRQQSTPKKQSTPKQPSTPTRGFASDSAESGIFSRLMHEINPPESPTKQSTSKNVSSEMQQRHQASNVTVRKDESLTQEHPKLIDPIMVSGIVPLSPLENQRKVKKPEVASKSRLPSKNPAYSIVPDKVSEDVLNVVHKAATEIPQPFLKDLAGPLQRKDPRTEGPQTAKVVDLTKTSSKPSTRQISASGKLAKSDVSPNRDLSTPLVPKNISSVESYTCGSEEQTGAPRDENKSSAIVDQRILIDTKGRTQTQPGQRIHGQKSHQESEVHQTQLSAERVQVGQLLGAKREGDGAIAPGACNKRIKTEKGEKPGNWGGDWTPLPRTYESARR